MLSYLVLLLAALSRFVPHALHGIGLNFTAVGVGLLFFGARRSRPEALAGGAAMALTDICLTRFIYDYPFHLSAYAVTWIWYIGVCLLGSAVLRRKTAVRVAVAVLCSATSFFVLSNFVVWLGSGMYGHTVAGLGDCYLAALPFYANDLVSTGLTTAVLFGLPVAAHGIVTMWREATQQGQPLG